MRCFRLGHGRRTSIVYMPAFLLLMPHAARAQGTRPTACPMIAGGGFIKVRGYDVVFSATSDSEGSTLRALIIVRAPTEFLSLQPPAVTLDPSSPNRLRHPGSGANVGPLMIVHESASNTVWIDSLAVRFTTNNNVVLVDVDSRGAFTAVAQARVEPRLPIPPGLCDDTAMRQRYQETTDTLWARFQASPQIRSFISP